jgi:ribosomal-protein-alanine N-acetyltransferase
MNEVYAHEIAFEWKYEENYSFYDMTEDEDDLNDFLNKDNWGNHYFAVLNEEDELIGFYSFEFEEGIMWLGFGLKPELTGIGIGNEFVVSGMKFGVGRFNYAGSYVMLGVVSFNKRAIRLYEKIGFNVVEEYMQKTNGGEFKFLKMKKYLYVL